MERIRLLPLALLLVCLPLTAAPPQGNVSSREARRIGEDRQKEAERQAKRAQRDAKKRQKEMAREIKRRDNERRQEAKQLAKTRRKQGKAVEAQTGQSAATAPEPTVDGPSKNQPSPLERLRGYSGSEPAQ